MQNPTAELTPVNQTAIRVHADDFPALLEQMGESGLNQRFTIFREPRVQNMDELGVPTTPEAGERPPIDVSAELSSEFTYGSPDSPVVQKWLADHNIQPGEDVNVRLLLPDGVVEKRVSTDRKSFFIPVDKLYVEVDEPVDYFDSDEFNHAQIVRTEPMPLEADLASPEGLQEGEKYVYVPRTTESADGTKTTRVEKWKLTTRVGENGKQIASSLIPEEKDGKVGIVEKGLSETTLSAGSQEVYKKQYEDAERAKGHSVLTAVNVRDPSEINPEQIVLTKAQRQAMRAEGQARFEAESEQDRDPYDDLPEDVKREVDGYRAAQWAKRDAENRREYGEAADAGREIYRVGTSMSPVAQQFVGFRK